jgi:acyl-CoA dehydrogenase
VVTEEFRVANAPANFHFVADRQSGPILLKYAPEHMKKDILPRICRGELCFAIGMSEPGSDSDLFAAKTKATKTDGGWRTNGSKIWTTSAEIADYMLALFRTSPSTKENRRHGLTQFLVHMKTPGITVNPVYQMTGKPGFKWCSPTLSCPTITSWARLTAPGNRRPASSPMNAADLSASSIPSMCCRSSSVH